MNTLQNKVAIITGANSGIGLATAKLFLQEGAKVVLAGRRPEALQNVSKDLQGEFITVVADVSKEADNENLIAQTISTYGSIDILFLNAGIAPILATDQITAAHFTEIFDTNVKGPILTVKAAIPYLNTSASVLFTNSIVHQKGFAGFGAYSASKGALRAYARVLTSELKSKNIRVNSIAPGPIETPIYGKMNLPKEVVSQMGENFAESVPLGRFGTPEEVANTALFLASDKASFINGVELEVDGGLSQV